MAAKLLLLIVPAVIGIVLGVTRWNRKERKAGWIITVIVLNCIAILLGSFLLFF